MLYICDTLKLKLANIVTNSTDWFGKEFNVISDTKYLITTIPTLYIGYYDFKETHPDVNILDYKYDDNTFWTFTKQEDRTAYIEGMNFFYDTIYNRLKEKLKYFYIDPITLSITNIKMLVNKIRDSKIVSYVYDDRMLYIYSDDVIYGLDFVVLSYVNVDKEKLIHKIKSKKNSILLNSEILIEYKDFLDNLGEQVKWVPFLYSMSNEI